MALNDDQRKKIQDIQEDANRKVQRIIDDAMTEILDEIDIEDDSEDEADVVDGNKTEETK